MHMLAFCSRTRHDGGIADRRDMVATYRSSHTCRDRDDAQRISTREYGDADRNQNTEGSQEVPVANARKPATRKMMPGRSI